MNSCKKPNGSFLLLNNVVLHVLILFILLSALFVFYISKISSDSINGIMSDNIDTFFDPEYIKSLYSQDISNNTSEIDNTIKSELDEPYKTAFNSLQGTLNPIITNFLNKIKKPFGTMFQTLADHFSSTPGPLRENINKGVIEKILLVVGFLTLIVVILNILSAKSGHCGVFKYIGMELLIGFLLVMVLEFWFFTNVASKFDEDI